MHFLLAANLAWWQIVWLSCWHELLPKQESPTQSQHHIYLRTFPEEVAKSGCLMRHNATKLVIFRWNLPPLSTKKWQSCGPFEKDSSDTQFLYTIKISYWEAMHFSGNITILTAHRVMKGRKKRQIFAIAHKNSSLYEIVHWPARSSCQHAQWSTSCMGIATRECECVRFSPVSHTKSKRRKTKKRMLRRVEKLHTPKHEFSSGNARP